MGLNLVEQEIRLLSDFSPYTELTIEEKDGELCCPKCTSFNVVALEKVEIGNYKRGKKVGQWRELEKEHKSAFKRAFETTIGAVSVVGTIAAPILNPLGTLVHAAVYRSYISNIRETEKTTPTYLICSNCESLFVNEAP